MTTAQTMQDNGTAPPAVGSRLDRRVRRPHGERRDKTLAYLAQPRTKADLLEWGGTAALHAAWYLRKCGLAECEQVSKYVYLWRAKADKPQAATNDGGAALMAAWAPNAQAQPRAEATL